MPASLISGVSQSPVHQLDLSVVASESIMPASLISGVSQSPECQLTLSVE